jgi:hypothetical protein
VVPGRGSRVSDQCFQKRHLAAESFVGAGGFEPPASRL